MKYKVIFVNWTKPYFYKHEGERGYNKSKLADLKSEQYDMVDYELLIQGCIHNESFKELKLCWISVLRKKQYD